MKEIVLVFPGHVAGIYGEKVTVGGDWPDFQRQAWLKALISSGYVPQTPAFVPTFDKVFVNWPDNSGNLVRLDIVENYEFPSRETAQYLAHRYAINGKDLEIREEPFFGLGADASNAMRRFLVFPNGAELNVLGPANEFRLNPEDKSGVADTETRKMIAAVWQG
jgi:hypothetical protein